eukprot:5626248-Amphidinium_carterae.3
MHLQENGVLAVHMGPPEKAALTVFPTREQRGIQSLPLRKLVADAQWITFEGFLMSWEFVQLEVGIVRQAFRELLSRTMSLVRNQSVLSFPGVAVVGTEHHFHSFTVYAKGTSTACKERMAWEIQWLANSIIAAERRDYHMQSIRVSLNDADWPSDPESDGSQALFQLAHGRSLFSYGITMFAEDAVAVLTHIAFAFADSAVAWARLLGIFIVGIGAVLATCLGSRHQQPKGARSTKEPKTLCARTSTCHCSAHDYMLCFVLFQLARDMFLPCAVPLCVFGGTGHLEAFHCALYSRDQSCISPQGLVSLLDSLIAQKAVGTLDSRPPLLSSLAQSDSQLGQWGRGESPGGLLRRDFIRGSFLDLTILSEHFQVGITVIDSEGVLRLHVRREAMIGLQINSASLDFSVLGFALADNQLCPIIKENIHFPSGAQPLIWCASTHMSVANMLFDNPPLGAPIAQPRAIPDPLPRPEAVSSTLPWSSETSDPPTEFIAASLRTLLHGGGRKGRSRASTDTMEELSDDLLPLTNLLQQGDQPTTHASAEALDSGDVSDQYMDLVAYYAKFPGGRTTYSQPLWKGTTWAHAHSELNREVRQRKSHWCMCWNGLPVDPEATVPVATKPHTYLNGQQGGLSAPTAATHSCVTGQLLVGAPGSVQCNSVDVLSDHTHQTPATLSLVDSIYDSPPPSSEEPIPVDTDEDERLPTTPPSREGQPARPSRSLSSSHVRSLASGGGKQHRVQHSSVAQAAAGKLFEDLRATPYGLHIEHQCVMHTLLSDTKAARAVFQAQTASQRSAAFAAALSRAGLTRYSAGITKASVILRRREQGHQDGPDIPSVDETFSGGLEDMPEVESDEIRAAVDPYMTASQPKKRGRPKRSDEAHLPTTPLSKLFPQSNCRKDTVEPEHDLAEKLVKIVTRIEQLEQWAHGIDAKIYPSVSAKPGSNP